jgi:hypothetical protein
MIRLVFGYSQLHTVTISVCPSLFAIPIQGHLDYIERMTRLVCVKLLSVELDVDRLSSGSI